MKVNPLIVYWRPKDLPEVLDNLDKIDCDKMYCNYMKYPTNYNESRKHFLDHPEYTHYVALPNDLVVTKEIFEKMCNTLENNDYPVLSGCCNVDMEGNKDKVNVCLKLPDLGYDSRIYRWLAESQRLDAISRGHHIIELGFAGFPCMFIRRDILEKIPFATVPFETDLRPMWETRGGFGGDIAFCTSLKHYGIPNRVDLTCMMKHLRFEGKMLVGVKEPNIEFKYKTDNLIHAKSV